jgi:hypothetical protein
MLAVFSERKGGDWKLTSPAGFDYLLNILRMEGHVHASVGVMGVAYLATALGTL